MLDRSSLPPTGAAPSSEVPPQMTILDLEPEERAEMLRRFREAETLVPCPACTRCAGCSGLHMVTPERARQIASGEIDDPETGR